MTDLGEKLDRVIEAIHRIDVTLARQEENLREHMRRTEIAEKNIENLRTDLKPVQQHVTRVEGVAKALTVCGVIVGIVTGVIKVLEITQ
jgi:hypothetical protein